MISNSVTQLVALPGDPDTLVWGANSFGVLKSDDFGASFITYTDSVGLGYGGVSGLAANDWLTAAATVTDTSIADVQGAGTGIAYSLDAASNWQYLEQPLDCYVDGPGGTPGDRIAVDCYTGDTLDTIIETPVTTTVENITWGLALEGDSAIWTASFAGGFRRYSLNTGRWVIEVPDEDRFEPVLHLNHRAFSVLSTDAGIWAGSAGGVNFLAWDSLHAPDRQLPGGGWRHFDYQHPQPDGEPTVTGNWVVSMARQELTGGGEAVWVGGWATLGSVGDYFGLSYTRNNGDSWTVIHDLDEVKVWDMAFQGEDVWVASEQGLWKSNRGGAPGSWSRFGSLVDASGREQLVEEVYAVAAIGEYLLVGSTRGLMVTTDRGNTWQSTHHPPLNHRFFPNPFSPNAFVKATIAVELAQTGRVNVTIYDFAMEPVKRVAAGFHVEAGVQREIYWDGTNRRGDRVANGVYFYHIEAPGLSDWGKLIVIK